MATGEIHIELAVNFAEDPKLRSLLRYGHEVRGLRDLYVLMICYCKRNLTDGFVPLEEIGLMVYPDSWENGQRDAKRLAEVGLITETDGGYVVAAYVKRNRTKAEVLQLAKDKASGGSLGNHKRWHEAKGIVHPDCPHCDSLMDRSSDRTTDPTSDPNSDPTADQRTESDSDRAPNREGSPETETETETETDKTPPTPQRGKRGSRRGKYDYDSDPNFGRFWKEFPAKEGKPSAFQAWNAALARGANPEHLIYAARQYRLDPKRDPDRTKWPQGWLNDERYDKYPMPNENQQPNHSPQPDEPDLLPFWRA